MDHLDYGLIVLVGAVTALLVTNQIKNFNKFLLLFDSLELGFFAVDRYPDLMK